MSSEERKRAHETAILEMAYDLSDFQSVIPRERPDFALTRKVGGKPFGVEVTQLFVDESHARINLVAGYAQRLWSGGTHLHKEDITALKSVTVEVTGKDGNVRYSGLPAVIMETPGIEAFRAGLSRVIRTKAAREYDPGEFAHINLVILDWFNLKFDGGEYLTDRFFDDDVRATLKECPFREVFVIVNNTASASQDDSNEPSRPDLRVIPLQLLLVMERFYVTVHAIYKACGEALNDLPELNRLAIDHVSRAQGYGEPIQYKERPFLLYRGTMIEMGEQGVQVRDSADYELPVCAKVEIADRMDPEAEVQVLVEANANVFGLGYAQPANHPSVWGPE